MENAIRIIIFSIGLMFLALAVALPNISEIFTVNVSNVPESELLLLQFGLYGIFIGLMLVTVTWGES